MVTEEMVMLEAKGIPQKDWTRMDNMVLICFI